jgi:aspartate racemase
MIPSAFVILPALPLTPNGKVDRRALPAPAADRPEFEWAYLAPRDALESRLARIWEDVLGIRPIGVQDNIFELGIDSLIAARLFVQIERSFRKKLPPAPLFQAPTIQQLADHLREGRGTGRWTSLVAIQTSGSRPPLFCVHGGAGTIIHFQELARRLGPDQPFYGLQSRGLYGGAPPLVTVEEMATHYLSEIRSVFPAGPYYVAGYCCGGVVALEMAHQLRALGQDVAVLVLLNATTPARLHRPMTGQVPQRSRLATRVENVWAGRRGLGPLAGTAYIGKRLMRKVRTKLYLALRWPMPDDIRDMFFLTANARADRCYRPRAFPGRIALFHGEGVYTDAPEAWGGLASGPFEVHTIPGDHFGPDRNHPIMGSQRYLMREPAVSLLADRLRACLDRVRSEGVAGRGPANAE